MFHLTVQGDLHIHLGADTDAIIKEIRMSDEQLTARLTAMKQAIDEANGKMDEALPLITKIGGETEASLQTIQDLRELLNNQGALSPEAAALLDQVEAGINRSKASSASAVTALQGVDSLVPDESDAPAAPKPEGS